MNKTSLQMITLLLLLCSYFCQTPAGNDSDGPNISADSLSDLIAAGRSFDNIDTVDKPIHKPEKNSDNVDKDIRKTPISQTDEIPVESIEEVADGSGDGLSEAEVILLDSENTDKSDQGEDLSEIMVEVDLFPGPDHLIFSQILNASVDAEGKVNYEGIKKDISKLNTYLEILKNNPVQDTWSRNAKLAYWINAYNAFTIKLILNHYPVTSIQNIDNGKPWDKKWIVLGSVTYSLNQIENEIIRPQFNEPRIHFAVNCAARSCPPLANKAFTESNMEVLLQSQTEKFINNPKFNQIQADLVKISKIFEWYAVDFPNLISFLNKYSSTKINSNAKINYLEYDWKLNN